ncbi:hypothetical protein FRC08_013658 [Ceratobasidium sp. 394]|nr:hypothetical protein FRC08_013658 [Ceratobasidium sp. 394]KAG9088348.1 hypothetical protein FS749_002231 [Ceratobasidium sp. UAMH 11750]
MSLPTARRHAKYYFEDGNVVFLTNDNTLFRLHKSILKLHSTFFDGMFELKHPTKDEHDKDIPIDGSSDENPIQLGGSSLATLRDKELESICRVLYHMPAAPLSELSVDEAVTLLQVSTKFEFEAIHRRVVERLEDVNFPPWTQYNLAVDCLVDPWVIPSYVKICSLADYPPLVLLEQFSRRNASQTFLNLLKIREDYRLKLFTFTAIAGNWLCPYWETSVRVGKSGSSVCGNCLVVLKSLLNRILSTDGTSDLDGANRDSLPSLKDRLIQGIQPRSQNSLNICANCRVKEQAIVTQVLGLEDLEREVKKLVAPASS